MPETIYGLQHDNKIRYVGKTTVDPARRLRQHLTRARGGASEYVSAWLRSIGYAVELTILETDPPGGLDAAERMWIHTLRSYGCRLTNLTDGGDGQSAGYIPTTEARTKMSLAGLARYADPVKGQLGRESSALGGRLLRGIPKSAEHRAAISRTLTGTKRRPCSAETRDKIGMANTGTRCACRVNRQCAFCRRGGDAGA